MKYVARINVDFPDAERFVTICVNEDKEYLWQCLTEYANANYKNRWTREFDSYIDLRRGDDDWSSRFFIGDVEEYDLSEIEVIREEIADLRKQIEEKEQQIKKLNSSEEDEDEDNDTVAANNPIYSQKSKSSIYPMTLCTCPECVKARKEFDSDCGAVYGCNCFSCQDSRKKYEG